MNTYWLIEWPSGAHIHPALHPSVEWLALDNTGTPTESVRLDNWTQDASKAVRFPRKQDAETIIRLLWPGEGDTHIATEHEDVEAAHPPKPEPTEAMRNELIALRDALLEDAEDAHNMKANYAGMLKRPEDCEKQEVNCKFAATVLSRFIENIPAIVSKYAPAPKPEPTEAVAWGVTYMGELMAACVYGDEESAKIDMNERNRKSPEHREERGVIPLYRYPVAPKPPAEWMEAAANDIGKLFQNRWERAYMEPVMPQEIEAIISEHYSAPAEGWQWVPVQSDGRMWQAGQRALRPIVRSIIEAKDTETALALEDTLSGAIWDAMLAAAPKVAK